MAFFTRGGALGGLTTEACETSMSSAAFAEPYAERASAACWMKVLLFMRD